MSRDLDTSWHAAFLDALRSLPNIRQACQTVGASRSEVKAHREADVEFDVAVDMALEDGRDTIRRVIAARALGQRQADGTFKGGSDRMMELLAKVHLPELRARVVTGADGKPLIPPGDQKVSVSVTLSGEVPEGFYDPFTPALDAAEPEN